MIFNLTPSRFFAVGFLALFTITAHAEVVIVDSNGAQAHLVLPEKPHKHERLAAAELIDHIQQITGVTLPIHTQPQGEGVSILLRAGVGEAGQSDDAFTLTIADNRIDICGITPSGTLHGTYELLEQLGVRWYMPGELGTILPQTKTLSLPEQTITQSPSFRMRRTNTFGFARAWSTRMRLGGDGPLNTLRMPDVGDFEQHPDRYALVDGTRNKAQLCVTNPQTIAEVTQRLREYFQKHPKAQWFPIGNHGGNHCECHTCRALDPEEPCGPYTGGINVTDRYLAFVDAVFAQLGDDLPNKRIALTVAGPHMCAPMHRRGHPRMDVVAWTAPYCRMHGVNNPACPERMMVFDRIKQWIAAIDGEYYERGNWGNIAGPGLLFPGVHRYRRDMPDYHAAGVKGFTVGAYSHWISENPSMYVAAKLLWNADADVDAMLDEFYRLYYGPASEPMRQYHELLDRTMRDADRHAGTGLDIPHVFTEAVRSEARQLLDQAMNQADGIYAKRIAAVQLALDYTDTFCAMLKQRDRHDYAAAATSLDRAHALIATLTADTTPPLLNRSFAKPYLDLFFGNIVREAHARTLKPNTFVVGLNDTWQFRTDPQRIGQRDAWWNAPIDPTEWQPMHAYSDNWSAYGLRYTFGDAWYRQTVTLPAQFAGQPITLWIGAVDEQASVWVNGHHLGDSPVGAFKPFEFDATQAVRFGEANTVTLRTRNVTLDEIGTGGLLAPVFFYAPAPLP